MEALLAQTASILLWLCFPAGHCGQPCLAAERRTRDCGHRHLTLCMCGTRWWFRCVCAAVCEAPGVTWLFSPGMEGSCRVSQQVGPGLTLSDLPLHTLNSILYRLSDGSDIVTLGQVTPALRMLSEDRRLWKALCQYHFAEKQVSRRPHAGTPRGPRFPEGCSHLAASGTPAFRVSGYRIRNPRCSSEARMASRPQLVKPMFQVLEPRFRTAQSRHAWFLSVRRRGRGHLLPAAR